MTDIAYWLIAAVVLAGLELLTVTVFIFGPLAFAAAATAGAAALGASLPVQLAVFAVLSIVALLCMYPVAKRIKNGPPDLLNNAESLVGKKARVLNRLGSELDEPGLIRLENENWTARAVDGVTPIEPNASVIVKEIRGATAICELAAVTDEVPVTDGEVIA